MSIVVGIGWLLFLVIFLAFYAESFGIYQNLAIIFASLLVVCAILAPMWAYWGGEVRVPLCRGMDASPTEKTQAKKINVPDYGTASGYN